MRVLVLVEHDGAHIHPSTTHVLTAARALGDEIVFIGRRFWMWRGC